MEHRGVREEMSAKKIFSKKLVCFQKDLGEKEIPYFLVDFLALAATACRDLNFSARPAVSRVFSFPV